jgi:hypothetical protein
MTATITMDAGVRLAVTVLLTTHALSLAVWIGVMLFNLIVNFPAQRAAAPDAQALTRAMGEQARRAAPWLYVLMALTALSGLGLQALPTLSPGAQAAGVVAAKWAAIACMAAVHGWGSWRQWPRIYFALDTERPALFRQYQVAMAASAGVGILAMMLSFWARTA